MEKSIESLADAEQNSAKIMNKELDFHLNSSEYAFNLLSFAINLVPEMKVSEVLNSMKVVVSLLVPASPNTIFSQIGSTLSPLGPARS